MVYTGCYIQCISDNGVACRRSRDLSDKRTSKGVKKGDILVVDEVCDDWVRYKDSWLPLHIGGVPKFEMLDGADLGAGICKQGPSLWNSSCTSSVLQAAVKEMSRSSPPMTLPRTSGAEETSKSAPAALRSEEPCVLTPRGEWDMIRAEAELFEQDLLIRRQSSSDFRPSPTRTPEPATLPRQMRSAPTMLQAARTPGHQRVGALQCNLPHGHVETSVECHVHREDELVPSAGSHMAVDGLASHDRQRVNDETDKVLLPSTLGLAPTQAPVVEHVQEVGRGTECRLTVRVSLTSSIVEAPGTSMGSSATQVAEGADGRCTIMPLPCDSPTDDLTLLTRPLRSLHTVEDNRATLHEGWVYKRSRHLGVWRRRWMVLEASGLIRCFPDETSSREATSEFRIPNGMANLHRRSDGVLALAVRYMSRRHKCLRQLRKICGLQNLRDADSTAPMVLVFDAGAAGNNDWSQALARTFASPSPTGPASGSRMPNVLHANVTGDSGTIGQQSSVPNK